MTDILNQLGIHPHNDGATTGAGNGWIRTSGQPLSSVSPIDGRPIASVNQATTDDYATVVERAQQAFIKWRLVPAPRRGQIVREIGDALRRHKESLGRLVTLEMGKILEEGYGEVQEIIDIVDFSVGLSRQQYGLTMHSERPRHRMYEQWHPSGLVGVVTAFNFPVVVGVGMR